MQGAGMCRFATFGSGAFGLFDVDDDWMGFGRSSVKRCCWRGEKEELW
jgi:hypothetical protein